MPANVNIRVGDRVLVQGTYTGIVKYVGDLDSEYNKDDIYIGVKLDDPVGKGNGLYEGKRFFQCPNYHGVVVPLQHVHLLAPREGYKVRSKVHLKSCTSFETSLHAKLVKAFNQTKGSASCKDFFSPDAKYGKAGRDQGDWEPESSDHDERDAAKKHPTRKIKLPLLNKSDQQPPSFKGHKSSPELRGKADTGTLESKTSRVRSKDKPGVTASTFVELGSLATRSGYDPNSVSKVSFVSDNAKTISSSKIATGATSASHISAFDSNKAQYYESQRDLTDGSMPVFYHHSSSDSDINIRNMEEDPDFARELHDLEQKEKYEEGEGINYSRFLLSGMSARDSATPPPPYGVAVDSTKKLKEMIDLWGGGEKGFHMALTLQKLHAAQHKGEKELEWQRELHEMDTNSEFAERKKQIDFLKEEILAARRRSTLVDDKIEKLQEALSRSAYHKELAELKHKIQKLQKKNAATLNELKYHPVANSELVRKTIARITQEYRERKKNIEETGRGHAILQSS